MDYIRLESTKKGLSSLGGLFLCNKVMQFSKLWEKLVNILPDKKNTENSWLKFRALCLGFIGGAECLDDMSIMARDKAFCALAGQVHSPNTYGDYLRQFNEYDLRMLNEKLIENSLNLRQISHAKVKEFILDIDSTSHVQYGQKMEGVCFNHKNEWCLDSLQAFDQFGYQYWMNVRPGSTFTSNNAAEVIHAVFSKVSKKQKRYLRADSGYCNTDVFNAARVANVSFVTAMRENMLYPLLSGNISWQKTNKLTFRDGRACEVGEAVYQTKKGIEALRVVVLRARKEKMPGIIPLDNYDYVAFVTNMGVHEKSAEKIVKFYRGRGNAENFIKDLKYGFDLKHFPCQKLLANKAYGLIAAFAYNITRFLAFIENPKKQHFAKGIRVRMIFLPVQVVKHAREVVFKFCEHHLAEVELWINRIRKIISKELVELQ